MSALLATAAIMGFVTDPLCGGARPESEFARRLTAIAIAESAGDALAIGVNEDRARGLPAARLHPATAAQAVAMAQTLLAQGRSVDLGLMQINDAQLARHHLSLSAAFDPCRNMAAGSEHYADDIRAVWNLAHRRYNTGGITGGQAYAAGVERVLTQINAAPAAEPMPQPPPPDPSEPFDLGGGDDATLTTTFDNQE